MRMYDIIKKKRDGGTLSRDEINYFLKGYTEGEIPDYQASALMMAIYFKGMNFQETLDLTLSMLNSGDIIDLQAISGIKADKHSTGGVGDKTTLIVAPIVAACGVKVAKMSGRGLGHTGGTIDKLEAIPGFQTAISKKKFIDITNKTGLCIMGQSENLAPADKKLYALRDVTATVESLPLIVSSIMSKKLAVGADCITFDVKTGSGSFCKTLKEAKELAEGLVAVGKKAKKSVSAVISNMDRPLGKAIGNSLEVIEALEVLSGKEEDDLREISLALACNMLSLAGKGDYSTCYSEAKSAIESGKAKQIFINMVEAQGGDISYLKDTSLFKKARFEKLVKSPKDGYITKMNTESLGVASVALGAGRRKKEDVIDYSAGIILYKKTGDFVQEKQPLALLLSNNEDKLAEAEQIYLNAIKIDERKPKESKLILDIIT